MQALRFGNAPTLQSPTPAQGTIGDRIRWPSETKDEAHGRQPHRDRQRADQAPLHTAGDRHRLRRRGLGHRGRRRGGTPGQAAAADRPTALLRRPRNLRRTAFAGRQVDFVPQALPGRDERLGEGHGRAVRRRQAAHRRHQAAPGRPLLDGGQPLRAVRPGRRRHRGLPRLRGRSGRRTHGGHRRAARAGLDTHGRHPRRHLRRAGGESVANRRRHQRSGPRAARRLPAGHRHRRTGTPAARTTPTSPSG